MVEFLIPCRQASALKAYVAIPTTVPGPWPGVVVLHDVLGSTSDLRASTNRLADAGYIAVAPDLYSNGRTVPCIQATFRSLVAKHGATFDDIDATLGDAHSFLTEIFEREDTTDGDKVPLGVRILGLGKCYSLSNKWNQTIGAWMQSEIEAYSAIDSANDALGNTQLATTMALAKQRQGAMTAFARNAAALETTAMTEVRKLISVVEQGQQRLTIQDAPIPVGLPAPAFNS